MFKKLVTTYLIFVSAVILIGSLFVYFYRPTVQPIFNTNTDVNINQSSDTIQIIPPTKTDCTDELDTACWNTYRNNEYGFEFRYPGGFMPLLSKNSKDEVVASIMASNGLWAKNSDYIYKDIGILSFFIYHSDGRNIADWLKKQLPKFDIFEKRYIDDHHLILRCGRCDGPEDLGDFAFTAGNFISDSENNYIMNYGGYYDSNDFSNGPGNQVPAVIVSTFRFVR